MTCIERLDNSYRLAFTFSMHLRNYKMITGSSFLDSLMDSKWVSIVLNIHKTNNKLTEYLSEKGMPSDVNFTHSINCWIYHLHG